MTRELLSRAVALPILLLATLLLPLSTTAQSGSSPYCHFLGPVFPPPKSLSTSPAVQQGLANLESVLTGLVEDDGALDALNGIVYLQVFSADEKLLDFGHVPEHMTQYLTAGTLDEDTLFRIGSVSKLIAVYALLAETGLEHVNDPVTEWIPELKAAAAAAAGDRAGKGSGDVEDYRWDEITLGSLASHLAGVNRGLGLTDLVQLLEHSGMNDSAIEELGLPLLPEDEKPKCGAVNDADFPPCSRKDLFEGLASLRPVVAPFQTPIYSNLGFELLGFAIEGIANRPFDEVVESALQKPLNMTRTYADAPEDDHNAVIPGSKTDSWWNVRPGTNSAAGGYFSTISDLTALGQSILSSSLLPASMTRAWLKPSTLHFNLDYAIGMPWEIFRMLSPLTPASSSSSSSESDTTTAPTRVVDIYTKGGGIGGFGSIIGLIPDHGIGFAAFVAAPSLNGGALNTMQTLPEAIVQNVVPAVEQAAREQARGNFAGEYAHTDEETGRNSHIVLQVDEEAPGVQIAKWTRGGVDMLETVGRFNFGEGVVAKAVLYPVGLEDGDKIAMRAVFEPVLGPGSAEEGDQGVFGGKCQAWGLADGMTYGNVAFDEFQFVLDEQGGVAGLAPKVLRETLSKVA